MEVLASLTLVVTALQNLSQGSPLFPCSSLTDWHFNDSKLYYKNHLYIPSAAQHNLVSSVHSSLASGHGGFFHTYSSLSLNYWWLGMSSFICRFIMGCALCQQMKVNTYPVTPSLSPLSSSCTCPFQQLSVDLITGLPPVAHAPPAMVFFFLFLFVPLFFTFVLTAVAVLYKPGCAISAADTSSV